MKKIFSIASFILLSACAAQQQEVSPMVRAQFSDMTCAALNDKILWAYFKKKDLESHYVNTKPYFSTLPDVLSAQSTEMKEIEVVRKYHNDAAQIYNERKCGEYITHIQYHVPQKSMY